MLQDRHPYIVARTRYLAGEIPAVQAIGMVTMDPEFVAENDLRFAPGKAVNKAREIVLNRWRPILATMMAAVNRECYRPTGVCNDCYQHGFCWDTPNDEGGCYECGGAL